MTRHRTAAVITGLALAGTTAVGLWASTTGAAQSTEPPRPPWVNGDGSIDMSKMPKRIGVAGPDGKPLRDAQGRPVTVDTSHFDDPPAGPPASIPDNPDFRRKVTVNNGLTEEVVQVPAEAGSPRPGR